MRIVPRVTNLGTRRYFSNLRPFWPLSGGCILLFSAVLATTFTDMIWKGSQV